MIFLENFRIALAALRANKMRSILTTLGIIIGVAAVIAVVSIVQGLQFMITKELQGVGATFILVDPKFEFGPAAMSRQVKLTWEDGQAIRASSTSDASFRFVGLSSTTRTRLFTRPLPGWPAETR